jgi:hypothetical protein
MKKIVFLFVVFSFFSCNNDDSQGDYFNVAVPILMNKADFRNSVEVQSPKPIDETGKIYAYDQYIFVNNKFHGIQVIDNTNPALPQAIAYIKVPGNVDIAIKDDYLYADSSSDLVVFDISDMDNIKVIERLEDVFSVYDYQIPEAADYADFGSFNYSEEIIVGWTIEKRESSSVYEGGIGIFDLASANGNSIVGTGGSLARFQIFEDYLYTVASHEITIFDINNLSQPNFILTKYAGNNIETLFEADGFLYIGSTDGMYIYSLDNPEDPNYVSEFVHWTGCDPVVVDGNYAYLTIRGGNNCGEQESVLEVINISDKSTPTLAATYSLENPYGLGFKNNFLFVCDGDSGLKVFDKTNPLSLQPVQVFSSVKSKDVIPLSNTLLMIGDNVLYQYEYLNNNINLISTFRLD